MGDELNGWGPALEEIPGTFFEIGALLGVTADPPAPG